MTAGLLPLIGGGRSYLRGDARAARAWNQVPDEQTPFGCYEAVGQALAREFAYERHDGEAIDTLLAEEPTCREI